MSKLIVAFGDSNTRYWLGDEDRPGPPEGAWPARLEALLRERGVDARVRNEGCPGEQADFALAEFGRVTAGADLCILGFGTNDVKKPEVSLSRYLSECSGVMERAAARGLPLVVLGIPWFDADLAGAGAQARLPAWNEALAALCGRLELPFVDLYGAFPDGRWYNERVTPKRHLSGAAHQRLAEMLAPLAMRSLKA